MVLWSICQDLPQTSAANGKKEYSICLLQLFYMSSFNCSSNFVVLQIETKEWPVAFHHITFCLDFISGLLLTKYYFNRRLENFSAFNWNMELPTLSPGVGIFVTFF